MSSEQMQTALDIFGTADFEDSQISEDEEEMLTEMSPEDLKEERFRALRKAFEPAELKAKYATEKDEEIRNTDIPERFQLRMPGRYLWS